MNMRVLLAISVLMSCVCVCVLRRVKECFIEGATHNTMCLTNSPFRGSMCLQISLGENMYTHTQTAARESLRPWSHSIFSHSPPDISMRERKTNKKTQKSHEEIICCSGLVASPDKLSRGAHMDDKKAWERAEKYTIITQHKYYLAKKITTSETKHKPQQNTNHALYIQSCGWVAGNAGLNAARHNKFHIPLLSPIYVSCLLLMFLSIKNGKRPPKPFYALRDCDLIHYGFPTEVMNQSSLKK